MTTKINETPVISEQVSGSWILRHKTALTTFAAALTSTGTILTAPQVTKWLTTDWGQVHKVAFFVGVALMIIGVIALPLLIDQERKSRLDTEVATRFAQEANGLIRKSFSLKESAGRNSTQQLIASIASRILGQGTRVCLFTFGPNPQAEGFVQVVSLDDGGRPAGRMPFKKESHSMDDGTITDFLASVYEDGAPIFIDDVDKLPEHFNVEALQNNGFQSIAIEPIRRTNGPFPEPDAEALLKRPVAAAVSFDWKTKRKITEVDYGTISAVAQLLAQMYEETPGHSFEPPESQLGTQEDGDQGARSELESILEASVRETKEKQPSESEED